MTRGYGRFHRMQEDISWTNTRYINSWDFINSRFIYTYIEETVMNTNTPRTTLHGSEASGNNDALGPFDQEQFKNALAIAVRQTPARDRQTMRRNFLNLINNDDLEDIFGPAQEPPAQEEGSMEETDIEEGSQEHNKEVEAQQNIENPQKSLKFLTSLDIRQLMSLAEDGFGHNKKLMTYDPKFTGEDSQSFMEFFRDFIWKCGRDNIYKENVKGTLLRSLSGIAESQSKQCDQSLGGIVKYLFNNSHTSDNERKRAKEYLCDTMKAGEELSAYIKRNDSLADAAAIYKDEERAANFREGLAGTEIYPLVQNSEPTKEFLYNTDYPK